MAVDLSNRQLVWVSVVCTPELSEIEGRDDGKAEDMGSRLVSTV